MKKKRWIRKVVLGIVVVCFLLALWWIGKNYHQLSLAKKSQAESRFGQFTSDPKLTPPKWSSSERLNILLLGGDEREMRPEDPGRSDSMLVLSLDPNSKKMHLFSILRDTKVTLPGNKVSRINNAISVGGPDLAMKTVSNLIGLDIHYFAYIDFEGFIKLVDEVGGVDFEIEKDMDWVDNADDNRYDIHLKKGQQHLDGKKALQLVRFRHDKLSDFARTKRQREFLNVLVKKIKTSGNLLKLPDILQKVVPYVETNMSANDILKVGLLLYKSHEAGSALVPPFHLMTDVRVNGAAMLGVKDEEELHQYVQTELTKDQKPDTP